MDIPRVYLDTSVIGGCFDPEFRRWSTELVAMCRRGAVAPVLSDLTSSEVQRAPRAVRELHAELVSLAGGVLRSTAGVEILLREYSRRQILPARYEADMRHIAIATVAGVDVLVSWNFKHIVRARTIHAFNAANVQSGHGVLTIRSPREVASR